MYVIFSHEEAVTKLKLALNTSNVGSNQLVDGRRGVSDDKSAADRVAIASRQLAVDGAAVTAADPKPPA